jgi:hypothetical protein
VLAGGCLLCALLAHRLDVPAAANRVAATVPA